MRVNMTTGKLRLARANPYFNSIEGQEEGVGNRSIWVRVSSCDLVHEKGFV